MTIRLTDEQHTAREHLRTLAVPHRLRVTTDAEGWPIIPGRLGRIEQNGGPELAVYTDRPRLFAKVWAIPGVRRHQTGDTEMRALFRPPRCLRWRRSSRPACGARRPPQSISSGTRTARLHGPRTRPPASHEPARRLMLPRLVCARPRLASARGELPTTRVLA